MIYTQMDTKKCSSCQDTLCISQFSKDGKNPWCRACSNAYAKKYREENKQKVKDAQKLYNEKNKDKKKEYDKNRLEYVRERDKQRYATDINFRMKKVLRTRLYKTMKGIKNSRSILVYLGVDLEYFKKFIAHQFTDEMNWSNYAKVWEIDHVVPCSYFNLCNENDKHFCFHWTNMRPLLKQENMDKSDIYDKNICDEHQLIVDAFKVSNPVPS